MHSQHLCTPACYKRREPPIHRLACGTADGPLHGCHVTGRRWPIDWPTVFPPRRQSSRTGAGASRPRVLIAKMHQIMLACSPHPSGPGRADDTGLFCQNGPTLVLVQQAWTDLISPTRSLAHSHACLPCLTPRRSTCLFSLLVPGAVRLLCVARAACTRNHERRA